MESKSGKTIELAWSEAARDAAIIARRTNSPYDEEFEHGERGKGDAKAFAKGIAAKLNAGGLADKFKAATPEQQADVMRSSGTYLKAPESLAERFDSQDKFHQFVAKAVHHELG